MNLAINRCPTHGFWSISVDTATTGVRLTPSKCCGRWDTVHAWTLSAWEWRRVGEQARIAAEAVETTP